MTHWTPTARTVVAGVAGRPVAHSLSPLLHNAWIRAAGLNAVYLGFSPAEDRFTRFAEGLRGGVIRGLNVTLPFKREAMDLADAVTPTAAAAGAANLLVFDEDGRIEADNTDGEGLLYAFRRQAPGLDLSRKTVVILGAGGAARGAAATLQSVGAGELRIVNRSQDRARDLVAGLRTASAWRLEHFSDAVRTADVIINTTSSEMAGGPGLDLDFTAIHAEAVVMDMLYRPLMTGFLRNAQSVGLKIVDGLDMLIGQAIPSFHRLFGVAPPPLVDARALALEIMVGQS